MKKKLMLLSRIVGVVLFYSLILVASVFLTMSLLIKGEEVPAPNLIGKSLKEAYQIAAQHRVYLRKIEVNYDQNREPLTIINQVPVSGASIKEKSIVKIYVTSELIEVIVPDLSNYGLKEAEEILAKNDLKKRYISYMEVEDVPADFVISHSYPAGARVPRGSAVDILLSRGKREEAFIMPNIIGMKAEKVLAFFESKGLKIAKITDVYYYPGFQPGIVINQYPQSGHKIDSKNSISIEVSK